MTAPDATAALSTENLTVAYDGHVALDGVSVAFPRNAVTAVIGPSGCGKSTLLQTLNGLIGEEPGTRVEGTVYLGGKDTTSIPQGELRRRVGLVYQTPSPFPFSIEKNVSYVLKCHGRAGKGAETAAKVRSILEAVGLYDEVKGDLKKSALKLSGGQQQRLCIARALAADPEVLLLDEPCSALDVKSAAVVEDLMRQLKRDYTLVVVTHNIAQARRIADKVVFLYGGELVECGETQEFFSNPKQERTREFLDGLYG